MKVFRFAASLFVAFVLFTSTAFAAEVSPEVTWVEGGGTVDIGGMSSLKLDNSLLFLNKADTRIIQEYFGNESYDTELASVFPVDENESWFVLFEYDEVGHINDDEKDNIDAKALLKSYKQGTEEANKDKPESEQLQVVGWHTEPYYDETDRTLVWALQLEDAYGAPIINYNVRTLTREGYVSSLLVTDQSTLEKDVQTLETLILPNYSLNEGYRYEDYDASTDKLSEFGLTGLILGGAGLIAAKKAGLLVAAALLLKKFWFVLFAIPAVIWSWIKRRREAAASRDPYHNSDN